MAKAVEEALKILLSDKHLYQSVELDLGFVPEVAKEVHGEIKRSEPGRSSLHHMSPPSSLETITARGIAVADQAWTPLIRSGKGMADMIPVSGPTGSPLQFQLPTINTFCRHCEDRWPFNPVAEGSICVIDKGQDAWYCLGYQCQQCKGQPVRFLVRREGLKLRLAGRDPLAVLPTPKVLAKAVCKYYSDAQVAHHAGQTLAGLFLLRVFIEQFWRSLPPVQDLLKQQPRATGEELGTAYQETLPVDFKSRFPSLKDIYSNLSAAMHTADANSATFEESSAKVVEHFDARRLYKIV